MLNRIIYFITIILLISISFGQGIVGEYRLVGLNVVDYDFCRQNTEIVVTEKSGFDLNPRIIYTVQQGENIDYDVREPYPLFALNAAGVDLWVYFAEDGTATIQQGSTYPTESSGEGCFTEEIAVAIQEDFSYSLDLNSNQYIPVQDILGLESFSPYKGLPAGSIGISGSSAFDVVPMNPTNISIPFPIDTSSVFNNNNGSIPSNIILPGMTAGYVIKNTSMYSFIDYLEYDPNGFFFNENNPPNRPSLYVEWHAIDGTVNESGLGDLVGEDEDGDGTDFDSIYGLAKVKVTKVYSTEECGINSYDIAGNQVDNLRIVKYNQCLAEGTSELTCTEIADNWISTCIDIEDTDDEGNNLYIMDLTQDPNFNWGGYVTWNSLLYSTTEDENYLIDDSNENFDSSCMDDDDFSDCSGRIIYEYTPQCIPSFNMRYFMAEFEEQCQEADKDECGVCFGNGIPDGYCDCYFKEYKEDCIGICDADLTNDDLSCLGCDGVQNSGLEYDCEGVCGGEATLDCNGICGGEAVWTDGSTICCESIELVDCLGECNGSAIIDACGICEGTGIDSDLDGICDTEDICPNNWDPNQNDRDGDGLADACEDLDDDGDGLTDCWYFWYPEQQHHPDFIIGENCEDNALNITGNSIPASINLKKAYPNPFNPIVNFDVEISHLAHIRINIYSINGNFITNLYDGNINSGNHQFSWDASKYSSGIYIINLYSSNSIISQKIVLLK